MIANGIVANAIAANVIIWCYAVSSQLQASANLFGARDNGGDLRAGGAAGGGGGAVDRRLVLQEERHDRLMGAGVDVVEGKDGRGGPEKQRTTLSLHLTRSMRELPKYLQFTI